MRAQRAAHVTIELTDGRSLDLRLKDAHGAPDDLVGWLRHHVLASVDHRDDRVGGVLDALDQVRVDDERLPAQAGCAIGLPGTAWGAPAGAASISR